MANNTILVVDDEIGIRELLSEILRDEGYHVALAESAEQARIWRSKSRPDLYYLIFGCQTQTASPYLKSGQVTGY